MFVLSSVHVLHDLTHSRVSSLLRFLEYLQEGGGLRRCKGRCRWYDASNRKLMSAYMSGLGAIPVRPLNDLVAVNGMYLYSYTWKDNTDQVKEHMVLNLKFFIKNMRRGGSSENFTSPVKVSERSGRRRHVVVGGPLIPMVWTVRKSNFRFSHNCIGKI